MKTRLPLFAAVLVLAMGASFMLIWSISLYFSVPQPQQFWPIWLGQVVPVSFSVLLVSAIAYLLLNRGLIRPIQQLAEKMRRLVGWQASDTKLNEQEPGFGLTLLNDYIFTLEKMLTQASVTGLSNRVIFEDRLQQAISEGKRSGRKYALIFIQLENLDAIARRHGQYLADALLKRISSRVTEGLRESDNVSHFEKNLFALLLEVQDQDQTVALVEKIYLKLARRYRIYGRRLELTLALGVALYPDPASSAEQLYRHANSALAKAQNKDSPIFFYEESNTVNVSGFTLIQALRQALDNEEFKLVFQPVIELSSRRTIYFEALLRWQDSEMGNISIERTIQLAEKNQLIQPLTNWIFSSVCQLLNQLDIEELVIGINLSMLDLHDPYLPGRIDQCLKKYQIHPAKIMIEITEGQIMENSEQVVEILSQLGVMGLSLSIDDFGTGQASLSYLQKLPVEKLKIDQSFIRDMVDNLDDRLIVKATIELAHTLDLKVVAEGVETAEVHDLLNELKCDFAQGYHISRPLQADQIQDWYTQSGNS